MKGIKCFPDQVIKSNKREFESHALDIFKKQVTYNPVYREYIQHLHIDPQQVAKIRDIPCMPIRFFKHHMIKTGNWSEDGCFESSSTGGAGPSFHYLPSIDSYHNHARRLFEMTFGPLTGWTLFALLPSYLERKASSLVSMVQHLIDETKSPDSGFYLYDHDALLERINRMDNDRKVMLFGVSFALLDLASKGPFEFEQMTIVETGGMKGRREEITKDEFYKIMRKAFGVEHVYSEYGMTELLSQVYGRDGRYFMNDSMHCFVREINDPFSYASYDVTGIINIIDLANIHSCAFIETEDLGRMLNDESMEIQGRLDKSELRGCNLMVVD